MQQVLGLMHLMGLKTIAPILRLLPNNIKKAQDIRILLGDIGNDVRKSTKNQQRPSTYSNLYDQTVLKN